MTMLIVIIAGIVGLIFGGLSGMITFALIAFGAMYILGLALMIYVGSGKKDTSN